MYKYIKQASHQPAFLSLFSFPRTPFTTTQPPESKHYPEIIKELNPEYGRRLDKYIQKKYNLKWSQVQSLFRKKRIQVLSHSDQAITRDPSYLISPGDTIYLPRSFSATDLSLATRREQEKDAEIKYDRDYCSLFQEMLIYEDEKFMVINKFPGIAAQGGTNVKLNLDFLFNNYLNWKKVELQESYAYTPGIVHRLDKDTSGVMVLAKDKVFAAQFSNLLHSRTDITKTYLGVVEGLPNPVKETLAKKDKIDPMVGKKQQETLAKMLGKSGFDKRYVAVAQEEEKGKEKGKEKEKDSLTKYEVLGIVKIRRNEDGGIKTEYIMNPRLFPEVARLGLDLEEFFDEKGEEVRYNSILRYEIEGGKKHQIRIHSALGLGTSILHDRKFDAKRDEGIVYELLEENDGEERRGEDMGYINGQKIEGLGSERASNEVAERHLKGARKKGEFLFLHSLQLEFKVEGESYKFKGGLPMHMLVYFDMVFGSDARKILHKF